MKFSQKSISIASQTTADTHFSFLRLRNRQKHNNNNKKVFKIIFLLVWSAHAARTETKAKPKIHTNSTSHYNSVHFFIQFLFSTGQHCVCACVRVLWCGADGARCLLFAINISYHFIRTLPQSVSRCTSITCAWPFHTTTSTTQILN